MGTHTVFFIGKPGSGKGTQAKLLSEKTGWPIKSASDGLREIAAGGGVVGKKLGETMDKGILTPYWFPEHIFLDKLFALSETEGVIFDGFNRRIGEAELVVDSLTWMNRTFTVFHLAVSDEEVRRRLMLRSKTENRADDHVVEKRLEEYYANTEVAINFFAKKGVLIEMDGEGLPEKIAESLFEKLSLK